MWTLVTCIRDEHDIRFVLAAALLCVVAATTALRFHRRAWASAGAARFGWNALTGVVAGSGVWATHFVAMLAYHTELPITFGFGMTALSLLVAIAGMGGGFALAAQGDSDVRRVAGGALVGMGITTMHFMGIAAIRSAFDMQWNGAFVVAAIAGSVLGGIGAALAARRLDGWKGWVIPPAILVLGIVILHFTAMAAVTVVPDLTRPHVEELMSRRSMAVMVGGIALLIASLAGVLAVMEAHGRKQGLRSVETAFQGVPSGLAMFDAEGRLVLWNAAYVKLISPYGMAPQAGMTRAELLGQAAASGRIDQVREEGEKTWVRRVEAERHGAGSQEWQTPDGLWLRADMSRLDNGGTISVLSDVTDLKLANAAMAEARDRAEAASLAKSEFLANMSHEIRTPLNGILGMAQVMENDSLSELQRGRLKVVRESGGALLGILNDLLDLSKVQAGKLELEVGEVDIAGLAHGVGAAFEGAAAGRDLTLTVEVAEAVTGLWLADGLRLRQILSNLIGNGLKFTPQGGVTLSVASAAGGLRFDVRDTGIGIDADHLDRMFEKFSQADASTTREYGGTGLGLSICRELAEAMGGEISVASTPGEGSCFTVFLPLEQSSRTAPEAAGETVAGEGMDRRLRILAAEDNPTNQLVLRSLLEPIDCELVLANNGEEAVTLAGAEAFDIILMDAQMPVMNGIEATLAIRAAERASGRPRTPIVALSANVMNHQIAEYDAAGMDGWVAKPIELEKLYAALDAALGAGDPAEAEAA